MLEIYAGEYNLTNPLKDKLPLIIEYFVKFYGEEHREEITQKLQDTTFFFLPKINNNISENIKKIFEGYKNEIKENLAQQITDNYDKHFLGAFDLSNIKQLKQAYQLKKLTREQEVEIINLELAFNIKSKLLSYYNKKTFEILSKLDQIYTPEQQQKVDEIDKQLVSVLNNFSWYEKYKAFQKKNSYETKQAVLNYFSKITGIQKNDLSLVKNINKHVYTFLALAKKGSSNWKNEMLFHEGIIKDNIELFNFLGFNNGKKYYDYLNDTNLFNTIFNAEITNNLVEINKKNKLAVQNFMNENEFYADSFEKIYFDLNTNNYCKNKLINSIYDYMFKNNSHTAFVTHYFDEIDKRQKSLCVLPFGSELSDDTLFHELNHIVSTHLTKNANSHMICKSGLFNMIFSKLKNFDYEIEKEYNYEQNKNLRTLNEITTDFFSLKILDLFKKDGD